MGPPAAVRPPDIRFSIAERLPVIRFSAAARLPAARFPDAAPHHAGKLYVQDLLDGGIVLLEQVIRRFSAAARLPASWPVYASRPSLPRTAGPGLPPAPAGRPVLPSSAPALERLGKAVSESAPMPALFRRCLLRLLSLSSSCPNPFSKSRFIRPSSFPHAAPRRVSWPRQAS